MQSGKKQTDENPVFGQKVVDNDRRNRGTKLVVTYVYGGLSGEPASVELLVTSGSKKNKTRVVSVDTFKSRKFIKLPRGRGRPRKNALV